MSETLLVGHHAGRRWCQRIASRPELLLDGVHATELFPHMKRVRRKRLVKHWRKHPDNLLRKGIRFYEFGDDVLFIIKVIADGVFWLKTVISRFEVGKNLRTLPA